MTLSQIDLPSALPTHRVVWALAGTLWVSAVWAQEYDRSGPWWSKVPRPLSGMAYTAEPSDYGPGSVCPHPAQCKYFDSDFTNADFSQLWGPSGRNDLGTIRGMGLNFVALYDWSGSGCRNHAPFFAQASQQTIKVMVPFSRDYNVAGVDNPTVQANIRSIVYEVYGLNADGTGTPNLNPAVLMWRIGNENGLYGLPATNTAKVARIILDVEDQANIPDEQKLVFTSDVDFGKYNGYPPAISRIKDLQDAFLSDGDPRLRDVWYKRFIAAVNTSNPKGDVITFVRDTFPTQLDFGNGDGLALVFTELGRDGKNACAYQNSITNPPKYDCNNWSDLSLAQRDFDRDVVGAAADLSGSNKTKFFYGYAFFQWQNASWKCPSEYQPGVTGCTESLFGVQYVNGQQGTGNIAGGSCDLQAASYPVDSYTTKFKLPFQSVSLSDGSLRVTGTNGPDTIRIQPVAARRFEVAVNGKRRGVYGPVTDRIVVNGLEGDDNLKVLSSARVPAVVYGGPGNNRIVGGEGADHLEGGPDDDVIRGRGGVDQIDGGGGLDDIRQ